MFIQFRILSKFFLRYFFDLRVIEMCYLTHKYLSVFRDIIVLDFPLIGLLSGKAFLWLQSFWLIPFVKIYVMTQNTVLFGKCSTDTWEGWWWSSLPCPCCCVLPIEISDYECEFASFSFWFISICSIHFEAIYRYMNM